MKSAVIFIIMSIFSVPSARAQDLWTTFRAPRSASGCLAIEGNSVWCGTDYGALKYNAVTGEIYRYTVDDGLIDNTVNAIAVGPDDVKWFATDTGVSSFDGKSWHSFSREQIKSASFQGRFKDIAVDSDNSVWAASTSGIFKYESNDWNFIKQSSFTSIDIDSKDVVWAGSNRSGSGNELIRIETSDIIRISEKVPEIRGFQLKDIAIAPGDSVVWFPTDLTIASYNDVEKTVFEYPGSLGEFDAIDVDANGTVWFGNEFWLVSYNNEKITWHQDDSGPFDSNVMDIVCDESGVVWISTETILLSYDGNEFRSHLQFYSAGPVYNHIKDIAIDQNNVKWFAQYKSSNPFGSVSTFDDIGWYEITELSGRNYSIITIDKENKKWLTASSSLFNYNNGILTRLRAAGMENVTDILLDDDLIWIADGGDFNYPPDVLTFDGEYFPVAFESLYINSLARDSNNNIWMAGYELYRYDRSILFEYTFDSSNQYSYNNITVDQNDVIWMSIAKGSSYDDVIGIASYNNGEWTLYTPENSGLPSNKIWGDIIVDHYNVKWFGTWDAGVCRFDGETWTTFTTENSGLCDNKINAIAFEKNNTIWFGTDNGVSRFTGEVITTSVDNDDSTPEALPVLHAYPNPFNPATTIEFTLPESGFATLSIYSISGQKVRELAADYTTAGAHNLTWDGRDDSGKPVSSGVYITRLVAGKHVTAGRMILLK